MHERQSEETQHMWAALSQRPALSQSPALGSLAESLALELFSKGGRKIRIGDTALFQAGNAPPFIGILRQVGTDKEGLLKLGVNWLYRPADLNLAKGVSVEAAPNEIFYSFHKDDISAASLLHPCKVAFLGKGVELPSGVSSFVCRRVYDTANKCLWWLTDCDYTDEHQEEVDNLLARTKLEMQAAVQTGGPSPRPLAGPPSTQQIKSGSEALSASAVYSAPGKGKKRERADQNLDPSKRERSVKPDDSDLGSSKHDRNMKHEDISVIVDKDGGLSNPMAVDRLVQLMQQERIDSTRRVSDTACRRNVLAGIIAASEREDCLDRFVQQGGLTLLDDWLQEAQRGLNGDGASPKEAEKVLEELLLVLLQALDRLPVNLEALKTCMVGKSVNHLRTHKNAEIQKRARKLVDVWKKRVDAEMKLTGEGKSGSSHGIPWSCKQALPDSVHAHLIKGATTEVAIKSSGAFSGNVKSMANGCTLGESKGNVSASGSKSLGLVSPGVAPMKDGAGKVLANVLSDGLASLPKEEKSSGSSHNHIIAPGWTNVSGKGPGWKEEGKNSNAVPSNPKLLVSGQRSQNVSGKGIVGAGLAGAQKEVTGGKPLVWSRNSASDKICSSGPIIEKSSVEIYRSEGSTAQGRLIVRIPNPGKTGLCGGTVTEAPSTEPSGRGPAGVGTDRESGVLSLNSGDIPDGQVRLQSCVTPAGVTETCDYARIGTVGDCIDKTSGPKANDCGDVMGEGTQHGKVDVSVTNDIPVVGSEAGCDNTENSPRNKPSSVDMLLRCQPPPLGDSEDNVPVATGGMSLLATIAASEISCGDISLQGIGETNLDKPGITSGEVAGPRRSGDIEKQCSGSNNEREGVCDTACTFQAARTDGTRARGVELATKKCARERVEVEDSGNLGNKCQSGIGDSTENHTKQESMKPSVGEGASFEPPDERVPLERDSITGVSCFTQLLEPQGDVRLAIGGDTSRHTVSGEIGPVKDSTVPIGYVIPGVSGNQDLNSASVKAGKWETATEEKRQSRMLIKNGKRGEREGVASTSSGENPFEDDALQVAQQVGKEAEQDIKRFEKPASNVSVDNSVGDKIVEAPPADHGGVMPSEADSEHGWKSCEVDSAGQCKKASGPPKPCTIHNAAYSDDSQETVTERREDVDAGRTQGFAEVDEVDQHFSVDACNEESITSVPTDRSLLPDVSREEKKAGNANVRLIVSVSDQAGVPPNLLQNVVKPGHQTSEAGEPTTPEQATEVFGPSDGPVGGSDASERPDFDLNEGISPDENPLDDASTTPSSLMSPLALVPHSALSNLTMPIAVVAAMKGAFIPPASPLRLKGELGWKGSAATSAFRPAEPRRTPDRQQSAFEAVAVDTAVDTAADTGAKKSRLPLDIDLNVVDEKGLEDAGAVPQLPHSQPPLVGLGLTEMSYPQRSLVKLDLDLNRADEGDDSGIFLVSDSKVSRPLGSSTESDFSASRSVIRDFDLNDGPASDDCLVDDAAMLIRTSTAVISPPVPLLGGLRLGDVIQAPQWFGPTRTYSGVALPSFPSSRSESGYAVGAAGHYLSVGPGAMTFGNDQYQTSHCISGSSPIAYPTSSPAIYSLSGYSPGSGFSYSCSGAFPASSPPYVESAGSMSLASSLSSQALIPGTLSATYVRPPYQTSVGEMPAQDSMNSWTRPNLDLNAGPESAEVDFREDCGSIRHPSLVDRPNLNDEQVKALRSGTVKRKEPEGGWGDIVKSGYAHSAWHL